MRLPVGVREHELPGPRPAFGGWMDFHDSLSVAPLVRLNDLTPDEAYPNDGALTRTRGYGRSPVSPM